MNCPKCGEKMTRGELRLYGPYMRESLPKVVFSPIDTSKPDFMGNLAPKFVKLLKGQREITFPREEEIAYRARRFAFNCGTCKIVVVKTE